MKNQIPDPDDNQHADPVMEILYHGIGGRTHVTATFPLDRLESVVERVKAQRQCWADAEQRKNGGGAIPEFTFPASSHIGVPDGFNVETKSVFADPSRVAKIELEDKK